MFCAFVGFWGWLWRIGGGVGSGDRIGSARDVVPMMEVEKLIGASCLVGVIIEKHVLSAAGRNGDEKDVITELNWKGFIVKREYNGSTTGFRIRGSFRSGMVLEHQLLDFDIVGWYSKFWDWYDVLIQTVSVSSFAQGGTTLCHILHLALQKVLVRGLRLDEDTLEFGEVVGLDAWSYPAVLGLNAGA